MKKIVAIVLPLLLIVPLVAKAQNFIYVNNWLNQLIYWLRLAITVLMIAMTFFFLWSVFNFIRAEDADKGKKKDQMIRGIVGLFIAVAVWGIIRILGSVIGVDTKNPNIDAPLGVTCPPGLIYRAASGTCERL
jgi:fatty acid desaturase